MASVRYALRLVARKPVVLALLLPFPIVDVILNVMRKQVIAGATSPMNQVFSALSMVLMLLNCLLLQPVVLGLLLDSVLEQQSAPGWYRRYLRLHWYKPIVLLLLASAAIFALLVPISLLCLLGFSLLQIHLSPAVPISILFILIMSLIGALYQLMLPAMAQATFGKALRQTLSRGSQIAWFTIIMLFGVITIQIISYSLGTNSNAPFYQSIGLNLPPPLIMKYNGWMEFIQLPFFSAWSVFLSAYSFALVYSDKRKSEATATSDGQ